MSLNFFKKLTRFRGKRTRERLKRAANYLRTPELKNANNVESREKKRYSSSLKHSYPYVEEIRDLVAPDASYLDDFCLIGDNWQNNPEAPILPIFGCNDWKYGFLAEYFPEYRVAFAPRKVGSFTAIRMIAKFRKKIDAVAIWGYTENNIFRRYLKRNSISIWRIEDGFIRSAELGAAHSTPYSLAIDRSGIYYDPASNSDLEKLLNDYEFCGNVELLEKSSAARKIIIENKLSKYNPPRAKRAHNIKIRKRVAILGQVDSDASIKYGNPRGWSFLDLIKLAYSENPGADIVYRPHPEVFRGFQKSKLKRKSFEKLATISDPTTSFVDFIETIDHCYTISSLSGFEALIRGKKVTLVGVPFYAGWGLTDDRVDTPNRKRTLSIDELFAGAYLLYPKYLADLSDPFNGFIAACHRIRVDQELLLFENNKTANEVDLLELVETPLWPRALCKGQGNLVFGNKFLKGFNIAGVLPKNIEEAGIRVFAFFCLGQLRNEALCDAFLKKLRDQIDPFVFNRIILSCKSWLPSEIIDRHIDWLVVNVDTVAFNKKFFEGRWSPDNAKSTAVNDNEESDRPNISILEERLDLLIQLRDLPEAQRQAELLLLEGVNVPGILRNLSTICELNFQFRSVLLISQLLSGIDPYYANRFSVQAELKARKAISDPDLLGIDWLSRLVVLKPDQIVSAKFAASSVLDQAEVETYFSYLVSIGRLDYELSFRKVKHYVELGLFDKANKLVNLLVLSGDHSENTRILASQILSYQGRVAEALDLMLPVVMDYPTKSNVSEVLRLYILNCNYKRSMEVFNYALSKGVSVGDMHKRKLYFGNRMIEEAFLTFREIRVKETLVKYYSSKYFEPGSTKSIIPDDINSLLLVAIFGPGDEIRFASIYKDLLQSMGAERRLSLTVTPRLKPLFERSFPNIRFVETPRPRFSDPIDYSAYKDVPGSDLVGFINDLAVSEISRSDRVAMLTDFLASYRKSYDDFPGNSYLIADRDSTSRFRERLPADKILVGVSWRSSLSTTGRNEHYLNIEEISKLFGVENVQFVNLQYDDCDEELAWAEKHFPGRLLNFGDLDQYNDFDGVSALMSCLDLVISPATTVVELSGALGINTWLFSNSSEIDWRKKDSKGTDVWHSSVTIVDVEQKGNKSLLVDEISARLASFVGDRIGIRELCQG
ncbi:hypothetical protein [Marinobacter nauticus]|uniref:capsular polysaccharide export protein, LipB/KpsS family n=1 Tax=Marinobacter nauticus TaxID=2743 RepID=UPI001C55E5F1|nr:hypothetical protein [Marinobacter nauticus]MBW3197559.1 hypothetical protein [Marinobacter nauticus]MBY6182969.1 hypothetical protein [Marinobacter nauticus]